MMDLNDNEINEIKNDDKVINELVETNNNFNASKEISKTGFGDLESSISDGSKTIESRESRIRRIKDQSEAERQRKLAEILESQKQSNELRQKQQTERRKKIDELKSREEERRRGVEQRRRELDERDKEKAETMQKRSKEREMRVALSLKQLKAVSSTVAAGVGMSQSMISPRQTCRMSSSMHSSGGTSSGSEKCMGKAGYGRWPSSCDVEKVGSGSRHKAASSSRKPPSPRSASSVATRRLLPPDGFIEVDGHFIPASTRHAGCFLPYRGPRYRVRGVLAWAPGASSGSVATGASSSTSWWAALDAATTTGSHGDSRHPSIPNCMDRAGIDAEPAEVSASCQVRAQLSSLQPTVGDIKSKLATRRCAPIAAPPIRMVKAVSQYHLSPSSGNAFGREISSPRIKNRSLSKSNVPAAVLANAASSQSPAPRHTNAKTPKDDSIFDRLAKPRSGSQPPKSLSKEAADSTKLMSTSVIKLPVKTTTKDKTKSTASSSVAPPEPKIAANDSASPQIVLDSTKDSDVTETSSATPDELSAVSKSGSRRGSKNFSKSPTDTAETSSNPAVDQAVAYKMKLAEQRRIAREKKEEQLEEQRKIEEEARQKAAAEQKRMEEETRMFIEEEAKRNKLLEEERLMELERQKCVEDAEKKKKEDSQRELDEKRSEKLRVEDEARMDRKRRLEKIMSRVKGNDETSTPSNEITGVSDAVDDKNESLMEMSLDENPLKLDDNAQLKVISQPIEAWVNEAEVNLKAVEENECNTNVDVSPSENAQVNHVSRSNSPELLSDRVLDLPGPQSHNSCSSQSIPISQPNDNATPAGDQPPIFKSRILQSMLGTGRLNPTKVQDDRVIDTPSSMNTSLVDLKEKRNSLFINPNNCDTYNTNDFLPYSRSYNADMSNLVANGTNRNQAINGLSHSSESDEHLSNGGQHHQHLNQEIMDTYNEITMPTLNSNIDAPRISMDKLELRSDSTCSQFSSDECQPPMPPPHSRALELS